MQCDLFLILLLVKAIIAQAPWTRQKGLDVTVKGHT